MIIPKYFKDWFRIYGLNDDYWNMEHWEYIKILSIAWRSYRKGKSDAKKIN